MNNTSAIPMPSRRRILTGALGAGLAWGAAAPRQARAQDSAVPLRIIVGFPPGGGADYVARLLAEHLQGGLQQTVIVDNRPGAGGIVAASQFLLAAGDGNTLILGNDHMLSVIPLTMKKLAYDPQRDFVAVGTVAVTEVALAVHESLGVRTMAEYLAWLASANARPFIGVPAPGSSPEFIAGLLGQKAAVTTSPVPYKGGAPLMQDLASGQIPAAITVVGELLPYQLSGHVRILASTGKTRLGLLPNVPTFGELGLAGLDNSTYLALFARTGTPPARVVRLNEALRHALAATKLREALSRVAMQPLYEPADALQLRRDHSIGAWARIIEASGYKPQ